MALRKENNGTWTFYGQFPKQSNAKTRYYKKRGFKTRKEAKFAEIKFLEEHQKTPTSQIKLNDVIREYHIDAPLSLKESTLKGYKRIENNIIIPAFGNRCINEITSFEIQRWINNIYSDGVNGKKYADETIKGILLHLSGLLIYAVKRDWLIKNPCSSVKQPKNPNAKPKEKTSKDNYWEIDEYNKFMEYIEDEQRYDIYEFCFYTGVRIGELCALQWKHIDLILGTITIEQSLSALTSKITSPKTGNSYRTIKLPHKIVEKLTTRYNYISQLRNFSDEWFIFGDQKYISNGTIRRWFNEDVKKSGVKPITFHGLRHSHASYLLSNPMLSEQLIADRLGHTVKTLRDTYFHIYKKHRKLLDDYIDNL